MPLKEIFESVTVCGKAVTEKSFVRPVTLTMAVIQL
jgi:hypothetical protein